MFRSTTGAEINHKNLFKVNMMLLKVVLIVEQRFYWVPMVCFLFFFSENLRLKYLPGTHV